jgi:hypothetical protein
MGTVPVATQRARIFISYKRCDPDQTIAAEVYRALSQQHEVFIDQTMLVGTPWAQRIEDELRRADFLITFLSEHSIASEMVLGEIETAHRLAKERNGPPVILPVRLAYREPFKYPLSAYLNPINWASWDGPADTPRLIDELNRAITGGALAGKGQPAQSQPPLISSAVPQPLPSAQPPARRVTLDLPEGTIDTQSKFYVLRPTDDIAREAIHRQGVTITIKGPRQMGKSSLLIRTTDAATCLGKRVAFLDFQLFDKTALSSADVFFRQFCSWMSDVLELEDRTEECWKAPLGNSQRCARYVGKYLLKKLDGPLVLAMDEVESIFETDYRTDFFSMLRSWHNSRATQPIWKQLDLALVTSTEPYQLIENLNQSPFNVGEVIEMSDFTLANVTDLNQRHGAPLSEAEVQKLMALLNGHPYLVRRALYLVADGRMTASDLFAHSTDDRGPFGDHLRYHLFRLNSKEDLIRGLQQVIRNHSCQDEEVFFRLRGAGLVRREGRADLPRCQLYADYFREYLHV